MGIAPEPKIAIHWRIQSLRLGKANFLQLEAAWRPELRSLSRSKILGPNPFRSICSNPYRDLVEKSTFTIRFPLSHIWILK